MGLDLYGQFDGKSSIVFMAEEYEALGKEYRKNQPVRCKITKGNTDIGPSLEQSNLLHACFKLVSENKNEDMRYATQEVTKMSCKIGIDFRDPRYVFVRPDGGVQFAYRSFKMTGPDALKGQERIEVIQKAFEWLAASLGVEADKLIEMAQEKMYRR